METNKKSSSKNYLLIGIVAAQFAVIAYLLYSNVSKKTEIEELTTTVDTKSEEIVAKMNSLDSLQLDLDRIKKEREELGLNNDSLNMQIEELKQFKTKALAAGSINIKDKQVIRITIPIIIFTYANIVLLFINTLNFVNFIICL